MKSTNRRTQQSKESSLEKRLAKLERYQSTHRGDLKKTVLQGYYTPTPTGDVYYLSGTNSGDTVDDRAGNVINAQRWFIKLNIEANQTCAMRVLVFVDKFNRGVMPVTADILEVNDVTSPLNYANTVVQKRFRVLHDKTYNFSLNGTLSVSDLRDIAIPMKIRYTGTGASSAFAGQNSMFILLICDNASPGLIGFNSRILFTDE